MAAAQAAKLRKILNPAKQLKIDDYVSVPTTYFDGNNEDEHFSNVLPDSITCLYGQITKNLFSKWSCKIFLGECRK